MTTMPRVGDKVHYKPDFGDIENGMVKDVRENPANYVWVVYKCDGRWDKFKDFTGEATKLENLWRGWV